MQSLVRHLDSLLLPVLSLCTDPRLLHSRSPGMRHPQQRGHALLHLCRRNVRHHLPWNPLLYLDAAERRHSVEVTIHPGPYPRTLRSPNADAPCSS